MLYQHWRQPPIFPDALEFLEQTSVPVVVVSNIDRDDIEAAIDLHRLSFAGLVTSEDVGSYKPHPELFEAGLHLAGADRGAALHVGDSLSSDVRGAKALGIAVTWANREGRDVPEGDCPDHVLTDLVQLAELTLRKG